MSKGVLLLISFIVCLFIAGMTVWGTLALWFALPFTDDARAVVVLGYLFAAGYAIWRILRRRRPVVSVLPKPSRATP